MSSSLERTVTDDKYDQSSTRSDTFSNTLSLSQDLLNLQHNEQFRQAKLKIENKKQHFEVLSSEYCSRLLPHILMC